MEVLNVNSTVLEMSNNFTDGGETMYKPYKHIPPAFIWHLTVQFINMFLGIPANITVLWLIYKNKGDSSTFEFYIPHLAALDLSFCLSSPLDVTAFLMFNRTIGVIFTFFVGLKYASPLFLCCISLDCYLAVVHPLTFTKLKDSKYRVVLVTLVWLIILSYAAARYWDFYNYLDYVWIWIMVVIFAFMVFFNTSVLWALRKSGPDRDEMHPVKKKAFQSVVIILVMIVCFYLPWVVIRVVMKMLFLFWEHLSAEEFRVDVVFIAIGIMNMSSTTQPLLYLFKQKKLLNLHCCGH